MRSVRLLTLATVALAACVTVTLSPEAARVRVTSNPEAVHGCKYMGPVSGNDNMNGGTTGQMAAEENARRELMNDAAKKDANTVLMVSLTTSMSGARQRGEAYKCPVELAPVTPRDSTPKPRGWTCRSTPLVAALA